ncbi:MAG: choice-of-anchor N protein [Candidatus Omnitrophica bacterium]|nr:choice-of-anchor N protein [Candidatus Omnitrophota bacterium]
MNKGMRKNILVVSVMLSMACLLLPVRVFAIPLFQVYIEGAIADDRGEDEDTWFTSNDPFTLKVVGAYKTQNITSLTDVKLLVSVPEGETGTISFSTSDESPVFLLSSAVTDFFPSGLDINHYPVKDDVSDFLVYNIGGFSKEDTTLYEYNADGGVISSSTKSDSWGEEKVYSVTYGGFSWLHIDVYGLVNDDDWVANPGSHDGTADGNTSTPEPATLVLLGSGLLGIFGIGRRKK